MKLEDIKDNMIVVCKKPHCHESINSWVSPEMDNTIGKPMKVIFFDKNGAFCESSEEWYGRWYYDIEWLEPWEEERNNNMENSREVFMAIVYDELYSDGDNYRANRIIDAADEYVKDTMWSFIKRLMGKYDEVLSIGDVIEELNAMEKGEEK